MKCPHCRVEVHEGFGRDWVNRGNALPSSTGEFYAAIDLMVCPACKTAILRLVRVVDRGEQYVYIFPRVAARPAAPPSLPAELAEDFNEACAVLTESPKASAALSRRCLQGLLRTQGYTQHDLAKAIDAVLAAKALPSHLAGDLDAIRNIGNFAAHPMKDTNTGAILPVEPHEAEWNLDVLEGLFDFYYVQPAIAKAKRDALDAKLAQVGKPPMKN
jgi:uncharacterized protein YbaR (Trm112 family)